MFLSNLVTDSFVIFTFVMSSIVGINWPDAFLCMTIKSNYVSMYTHQNNKNLGHYLYVHVVADTHVLNTSFEVACVLMHLVLWG